MHRLVQLLSLFMLFVAAACSGSGQSTTTVPTPGLSFEGLPVNQANVALVAKVNGEDITLPEFQRVYLRSQQGTTAADLVALGRSVLDTLIEQALIKQEAAAMNLTVSDAELDTRLQVDYIEVAGSPQAWQDWLTQNLYTDAEFRAILRDDLITKQVIALITSDITGALPQVHARHILVQTKEEAETVMGRLQQGEDFATLAKLLSRDVTSSQQGGDLGWFTEDELLQPAVAQVAFSLQPGEIAGPVPTQLGYHIIQTLEYDERLVESENQANLAQTRVENWLQTLLEKATIERYLK